MAVRWWSCKVRNEQRTPSLPLFAIPLSLMLPQNDRFIPTGSGQTWRESTQTQVAAVFSSIFALSPGGSVEQCARGVVVSGSGRVVANAKTIHSSATVSGTAVKGNEECGIIGQCADIRQHNQTRIARQCLACRVLARCPLLQL
jgi:hypothetical protein